MKLINIDYIHECEGQTFTVAENASMLVHKIQDVKRLL